MIGPAAGQSAPDDGRATEPPLRRQRRARQAPARRPGMLQVVRAAFGQGSRSARLLLLGVAALVLLWPLSSLVEVNQDTGDLVAGTLAMVAGAAPMATVGALIVIALAARRHHWVAVALAAVAALLPWFFMASYAVSNQPERAEAAVGLRTMLVNAHQGAASAPDIVAAAAAGQVDVLVVTELSGALAHDLTVAGLDQVVSAAWVRLPGQSGVMDDPQAGMGVWTRSGITLDQPRDVPGTQWPSMTATVTVGDPAGSTTGTEAGPEATRVTLIAGHVAPPGPDNGRRWATDLAVLREATVQATGPRMLLANLNATSWHADFRQFTAAGIRDAADVLGRGPRPSWPTWSPLAILPLDHAMVSDRIGVESVETVVIGGSDHRALIATLRVPASP
ncbi:MAG: endonuclease/exonuclease/phosphatase family protein [Kineosporiaceae bacterium]|nr:endonuclease/exonuclease/phosphatase family protein [Kineosporiaceae bacterium]